MKLGQGISSFDASSSLLTASIGKLSIFQEFLIISSYDYTLLIQSYHDCEKYYAWAIYRGYGIRGHPNGERRLLTPFLDYKELPLPSSRRKHLSLPRECAGYAALILFLTSGLESQAATKQPQPMQDNHKAAKRTSQRPIAHLTLHVCKFLDLPPQVQLFHMSNCH